MPIQFFETARARWCRLLVGLLGPTERRPHRIPCSASARCLSVADEGNLPEP